MNGAFSMGQERNACKVLVRRSEGKRKLDIPRCRWKDSIKMDLKKI
jgi:hypothetical protein